MHSRFAKILLFVAVSMIYGTVMPLLYPITLLALFIYYTLDRLLVFYFYREPPTFDESLT